VGQYALDRDEPVGDTLAWLTWWFWMTSAAIFALARLVARDEGAPWLQDPTMPALLFNEAKPKKEDPMAEVDYLIVSCWSLAGALLVTISSHTLISQTYKTREPFFAALLLLLSLYEFLSALHDVLRTGSPYGIPKGWARYMLCFRSLVIVVQTILTAFLVVQSFPHA
jgi:hypothetical protein